MDTVTSESPLCNTNILKGMCQYIHYIIEGPKFRLLKIELNNRAQCKNAIRFLFLVTFSNCSAYIYCHVCNAILRRTQGSYGREHLS